MGVIIYAYRKDFNLHQKYYKGSLWVLLAFLGFITGIAAIKFILGY
ncbi:membrane protein [Formosa sp. Hel1_33_131]|nr:membrane protein [Formosa sp. Hel1_33_131]